MGRKEWYLSPVSLPEDDDKHEMKQRNHPPGSYSYRKGSPLLDTCHKLRITGQRKTQAATVLDVFFATQHVHRIHGKWHIYLHENSYINQPFM